jgi:hypothetical protein
MMLFFQFRSTITQASPKGPTTVATVQRFSLQRDHRSCFIR